MSLELFPGKHLFVDDHCIEELRYAQRVLNQPVKYESNPVLAGELPWEKRTVHLNSLHFDRERRRFRAWYDAAAVNVIGTRILVKDNPPTEVHESHICYAESDDCISWERPNLGIAEQERHPGNNICIPSMRPPGRTSLAHLADDPFETDPARRYKLIYLDQAEEGKVGGGLAPDSKLRLHAHSADGIHWQHLPWQREHLARLFGVIAYLDETPTGPIDPDARFILYGQRGSRWKTRQIGRRDSNDFVNWSANRPVLESRLSDQPAGLEFYRMEGSVVNRTYAGLHLGMLGAYHADLRRKFDPARNDGVTECQLAYSRDTVRWERWTNPFLERGEPGAFDYGGVYCHFPAITDDKLYFMYGGESNRHGVKSTASVGLATMRLDGFVSVETEGFMEGILVTRPHLWRASAVRLNLDSMRGSVRVQLQNEQGQAFEGFGTSDCDPLSTDALDTAVTWGPRGSDVRALGGQMVALKVTIAPEDKLFSYTLVPET